MFVLFDLDGVLVDFRELHKQSFIQAWNELYPDHSIHEIFHDTMLEARSTKQKIRILTEHFQIPVSESEVYHKKQYLTQIRLQDEPIYQCVRQTLETLVKKNIPFACCSNSILSTIETSLQRLVPLSSFQFLLSNEDVSHPKPAPDLYLKAVECSGITNKEDILVFEDSDVGKQAARSAGLHVIDVVDALDITPLFLDYVLRHRIRPLMERVNVVIPMAGWGSRFSMEGYTTPKPFLPVHGRPMYETVIRNIVPSELWDRASIHLVIRKEHLPLFESQSSSNIHLHLIDHVTEGPACTVLTLQHMIDSDIPLVIANSDQYLEWNALDFYHTLYHPEWDGVISTFVQPNPEDKKWSYVRLNQEGEVVEVAEKRVISPLATTGIYGWKRGSDFVRDARKMIEKEDRVNNEFYVCPVYQYTIQNSNRIRMLLCKKMWGLGVPNDYKLFCKEKTLHP